MLGLLYNLKFNIVCVNLGSIDWVDLYRAYTPTRNPNPDVRTAYQHLSSCVYCEILKRFVFIR